MSLRLDENEFKILHQRVHGKPPSTPVVKERKGEATVDYAVVLLAQIIEAQVPGQWFREFTFHESRNWRLDVACPARKLSIEIDGMVHRIKKRFITDMAKHNALTFADWHYLRCTPEQVRSGEALDLVRAFVTKGD